MKVKICGLTRAGDAALAESLGANYLGVIMAGGPRNRTIEEARDVLGPRRHGIERAVVFGAQPREDVLHIANVLDLDIIQLHGDHSPEDVTWLLERTRAQVWPVIRVAGTQLPPETIPLARAAGTVLLDAKVVGLLGGTGVALDWAGLRDEVALLRNTVEGVRVILAGGLNPGNVALAHSMLDPDAVDVSSGVEFSPGIKNADALEAFLKAAR